jgi:hypothetical protein
VRENRTLWFSAGLASARTFGRTGRADACASSDFSMPFRMTMWGPRRPEHHQHREERDEATDAQPALGGEGDTEAR